jgi:hypothetical protein
MDEDIEVLGIFPKDRLASVAFRTKVRQRCREKGGVARRLDLTVTAQGGEPDTSQMMVLRDGR